MTIEDTIAAAVRKAMHEALPAGGPDRILTLAKAARELDVSEKIVKAVLERGEIPHRRVGERKQYRLLASDLYAWVRAGGSLARDSAQGAALRLVESSR